MGVVAILGACLWCLRGLATPTVGFDARALWLMRAGWFLQSHHQLLIDMRVRDVLLVQTAYPPLVSAVDRSGMAGHRRPVDRLGVVIIALLNTCALAVAAFALIDAGRGPPPVCLPTAWRRSAANRRRHERDFRGGAVGPIVVGVVSAVLLVFVAFGITEPFMTNGYADPIWSLAAVGAVAYGLQLGISRRTRPWR